MRVPVRAWTLNSSEKSPTSKRSQPAARFEKRGGYGGFTGQDDGGSGRESPRSGLQMVRYVERKSTGTRRTVSVEGNSSSSEF